MKRIVITGIGLVSPLGSKVEDFWTQIKEGQSGIRPLTKLNAEQFSGNSLSAEVQGEDQIPSNEDLSKYSKSVEYAYKATKQALKDAGFGEKFEHKNRYGLIVGTTSGNQDMVERTINTYQISNEEETLNDKASEMLSYFRPVELSTKVAKLCNIGGTNMVIPTACAAGNYAFGTAYSMIQNGRTPIVVAGGADPFTRSCYTIFYRLGAMTKTDLRPFAEDRTGMVVGEGAAMLVLEELEHAKKRGATIYAEVTGYALSCDAYHPTAPDPEGSGATLAMKNALRNSHLLPKDISYISAHGTGTRANDSHEAKAMSNVFGDNLSNIPVHGLKSMLGHCMGAASALEAVSAVLSIRDQIVPVTINTSEIDQSFPKTLKIAKSIEKKPINHVLSNSFAFGGNICSVIFSKYNQ